MSLIKRKVLEGNIHQWRHSTSDLIGRAKVQWKPTTIMYRSADIAVVSRSRHLLQSLLIEPNVEDLIQAQVGANLLFGMDIGHAQHHSQYIGPQVPTCAWRGLEDALH